MTDARRRSGLGRGLGALLGDLAQDPTTAGAAPATGVRMLPVDSLAPHPDQPRRHFDNALLDELAQSIASRGLIQPIVVRPHVHGFQIVAGERRWRAAQRARLHEVPVVVRELSDAETLEVALVENIQRQDLNAIEEAQAYQRLAQEFGHTQDALARIVHKSRSHIANLLRLLDLPDAVQAHVVEGTLSMGHARALLGGNDIEALAQDVLAKGLSVRDTEKLVRGRKADVTSSRGKSTGGAPADPDISALEHQLADLLGLHVRIAQDGKGGTLTLAYATLDQLDMLCQRLSGEIL